MVRETKIVAEEDRTFAPRNRQVEKYDPWNAERNECENAIE